MDNKLLDRATILVAEDLDSNFLFLKIVLSKEYNIIRAKDGKEAVEIYRERSPDLILMDIKMPIMDGLQATKAIRELSNEVPIIAQTANAFESDNKMALEAGCNAVLTKPIKIDTLKKSVANWLSIKSLTNIR